MEGEGDSGPYTQAVGLIKSLRSTVNWSGSAHQLALNASAACPLPCFERFFRDAIHATAKLYTVALSRNRHFNTLQRRK